jgi:hypothetical protein
MRVVILWCCVQVGNIETEGREIVIGFGSSQVIVAAMYGLSDPDEGVPPFLLNPRTLCTFMPVPGAGYPHKTGIQIRVIH